MVVRRRKRKINGNAEEIEEKPKTRNIKVPLHTKRMLEKAGFNKDDMKLLENPDSSKTIKEALAVKAAQLDLGIKEGKLLDVAEVTAKWTGAMLLLRQRAESAPAQFKRRFPQAPDDALSWIRDWFGETADAVKRKGE